MKRICNMSWIVFARGLTMAMALLYLPAAAATNYCYNGSFNSSKGPLDGWNVDYDWTGNKHQMGNHNNVSYLPNFRGKKSVLKMNVPNNYESKIETPLIPYQVGDRYKCTFKIFIEDVQMKVLFQGYNLKPGIRPGGTPDMQDLRRMYKAENKDAKGASWKTMTVEFPMAQVSKLAYKHLKKVRYISVLMYVPGDTFGAGNFYLSDVQITKLPGKVSVKKK